MPLPDLVITSAPAMVAVIEVTTGAIHAQPRRTYLRDASGRLLGSYDRDPATRRVTARAASGRLVGAYDPRRDETRDASGRLIGRGNMLPALLVRDR